MIWDLEFARIIRQLDEHARQKLAAERAFLQSLDWTESQLATYDARILTIESRVMPPA